MRLKGLFSYFLLLFAFATAVAQQYNYRHYTTRDGLPSMMVYDILQDKKGYIWIATSEGVTRFDGYRFKTFTIEDGLPDNDIIAVDEGPNGEIWVVPFQKNVAYIRNDSVFNHHIKGLNTYFRNFDVDSRGHLWVTTHSGDMYECTDTIVRHFAKDNYSFRLSSMMVGRPDNEGNIWAAIDDTLIKIGPKKTDFFRPKEANEFKAQAIPVISPSNQKFLQGLYCIHHLNQNNELKLIVEAQEFGNEAVIINLNFSTDGALLVATSKGAFKIAFNDSSKTILPFLEGKNISYCAEDREGNLWFTTLNEGVYFLTSSSQQVINLNSKDGLPNEAPSSLFAAKDQIYLSYKYGSLHQLKTVGSDYYFEKMLFHILHSNLTSCFEMPREGLWCTCLSGVIRLDSLLPGMFNELKWHNRNINEPLEGPFPRAKYNVINLGATKAHAFDADSLLWLACSTGLHTIDNKSDKDNFIISTPYLERTSSVAYQPDSKKIWFSSAAKLYYMDGDTFVEYPQLKQKTNITTLYITATNQLIVGTAGEGLYVLNDKHTLHFTTSQGLPSNLINHVLELPDGLLVSTSRGLCYINHNFEANPVQFNDGLEGEETKKTMVKDTMLYVLTNRGLSIVPLSAIQPDTISPLVYISLTNIDGVDTAVLSSYTLPYYKNSIRLEYIGLSYKSQGNLQYRYQMEGIDTGWVYTTFTNVQYPTLPPGDYIFKVDARSLQGTWSNKPATMQITIHPPFWKTWWFRLLAILLGGAIVVGLSYAVIKYYRNQSKIAQRMVELEGQALRANMNPHFVFNALNAIHDFIANQDERSAHLYLGKFAQLIRRILDQSRRNFISLEEELDTLRLYLELENMRFEQKFEFNIKIGEGIQPYDIELPPMLIQPYLENAVRHGLMDMGKAGRITVAFEKQGHKLKCTIADNGIGRAKATELSSKRLKSHRSVGMEITQKRVELLNDPNQSGKSGGVTIIDLKDNTGQASGTQVELLLPLKDA